MGLSKSAGCKMESWRCMLGIALEENNESWSDIESNTMTAADMDREFDAGYGYPEGCAFTAWTKNNVYFPGESGGAEFVSSVPRNPNGVATKHI